MASFGPWDYAVFIVVLLISAGIGVYYRLTGGKQKTTKEYLLADRSMPILPVAFSLMASFMSAITLLGVAMENYQFGTIFVIINISYVLTTPIAAYLILPVFYRLKTASVYEYLEMRFGYPTRLCASLAFSVQTVLYMGIVLYAPALALQAVTGLSQVFSILVIGVVCTFYATIGGMKAVLVTDIFQSLLMFVAIYSVIICAAIKAGGLGTIWNTAVEGGRVYFLEFSLDPTIRHTFWTQVIGGAATYLAIYGVNQTQVQRLLSVKSLKASQGALWWNLPILMLLSFSTSFSGLCIYWYYKDCDPLLEGRIKSRDQLMPLFVVDTMSHIPAISGLFVSGIFSASLSTISSAISSMAAVTLEDYMKPIVKKWYSTSITDQKTALYSKVLSLIYGAVCIGLAFLAGSLGGVLQASLSIFGIIGGPLLGLFTLGMYVTKANQKGAITGLFTGLAMSFWIGFGQPKPVPPILPMSTEKCDLPNPTSTIVDLLTTTTTSTPPADNADYFYLYRISYMWYAVIGFLITFLVGVLSSWLYSKLNLASNAHIYHDPGSCTLIKYDLFIPPLAKRLQRKQRPLLVITGASSEVGRTSLASTINDDSQLPASPSLGNSIDLKENQYEKNSQTTKPSRFSKENVILPEEEEENYEEKSGKDGTHSKEKPKQIISTIF